MFNTQQISQGAVSRFIIGNTDINLVFDGDSLTAGIDQSQSYPNYIKNRIETECKSLVFNSFGVGGQTTQQMISDANTQIDPLIDPAKFNIIVAWEDINAILGSTRTGLQNFEDMQTYFNSRKSAGFDIGILIIGYHIRKQLDGTYLWPESKLVEHEIYRNLVRNTNTPNWDIMVDLTLHPTIGGEAGQTVNDLFTDSAHLTAAGYDAVGEWIMQNGILKNFRK